MRRAVSSFLLLSLAACATPPIRLTQTYRQGEERRYRVTTRAATTIDVAGLKQREKTELVGTSLMRVLSVRDDEATVRLTLAPERLSRDGKAVRTVPSEQTVELVVGTDGAVRRIDSVGGVPVGVAGMEAADLAPMLGAPLPGGRVRVGRRWSANIPEPASTNAPSPDAEPGVQTGRVTGLRRVRGYDCAMVLLGTRRALTRSRSLNDQEVGLSGIEVSTSRVAFAFRRGFPVEVQTQAEGRFSVSSGAFSGGSVVIVTDTRLTLIAPTA